MFMDRNVHLSLKKGIYMANACVAIWYRVLELTDEAQ